LGAWDVVPTTRVTTRAERWIAAGAHPAQRPVFLAPGLRIEADRVGGAIVAANWPPIPCSTLCAAARWIVETFVDEIPLVPPSCEDVEPE
jgi:hypothetical protein